MTVSATTKGYSVTKIGQIHWRIWGPDASTDQRDLICLHPSPFSGLAYQNLGPKLARDRRVIAPDYPGYGGSDRTDAPSIENYAELMLAVADDLECSATIDVLGFHSGCFVAAEMARKQPSKVSRLCMIDIPAFEPEDIADLISDHKGAFLISEHLECLRKEWDTTFASRLQTQGKIEAFAMFVEQLRSGENRNDAAIAAFAYPWRRHFPEITVETLIMATQSILLEGTRNCAGVVPGAQLTERLDITRSVLDESASETAGEIRNFLEGTT